MKSKSKAKKDKNIFSKTYNFCETKYASISEWLTNKGIPINKLNDFLESKGIPSFVFIISLLLIIVALILLLTIRTTEIKAQFTIRDYDGSPVDSVSMIIRDDKGLVYEGRVSSGESLFLPLKIGTKYSFIFSKSGYEQETLEKIIESPEENINISLEEQLEKGHLILTLIDSENERGITKGKAIARFRESGEQKEVSFGMSESYEISMHLPLRRTTSIVVQADGYENHAFDYTLESQTEQKVVKLTRSVLEFQGNPAKVTIVVQDEQRNPVDGANVELYNQLNELLGSKETTLGNVTFDTIVGQDIRFVVTKEGYRTYDSDKEDKSFLITEKDQTYNVSLELGGKAITLSFLDSVSNLPLQDVSVKIYNEDGKQIFSEITTMSGDVDVLGLDVDEEYIVSACLEEYLCSQKILDIYTKSNFEVLLEKQTRDNSERLLVWLYDDFGEPLPDGKVSLYILVNDRYIPVGEGAQSLDLSAHASFITKPNKTYKVVGNYGEISGEETITIEPNKDNRLILYLEDSKKIQTLVLLDDDEREVIEGHLLITTKDGYILLDKELDGTTNDFELFGYRELVIEYTDVNGNKVTLIEQVGDEEILTINIDQEKQPVGNFPIVDFVGVEDAQGHRSNFVTPDNDYFLIFNVVFPANSRKGGLHIRAGTDDQKDVDNMAYGITGFRANTIDYTYSMTYTKDPAPGISSIDFLNTGREGELNKWLNLEWSDEQELGQHQIRVKIETTDINPNKLKFKYRAWVQDNGYFYRDPKDDILDTQQITNEREGLYANTKNLFVDVFETPADCSDDFCISYKFIDEDLMSHERGEFYAVEDNLYALEVNLYSFKNTEVNLLAKTSTTSPIISFVSLEDRATFPQNINIDAINELEVSENSINLTAGVQKKMYLFFATKALGSTYVDLFTSGPTISSQEERFSFNILPEKEMAVELIPDFVLTRGEALKINVRDAETNEPIENAFIKIENEYKEFITSLKGDRLNGRGGEYTISQNINSNKIFVNVSAYGYKPITRELVVGDTGLIHALDQININVGEEQSQVQTTIDLRNTGRNTIENIKTEVSFILPVSTMHIETIHDHELFSQTTSELDIIVNVNKDVSFRKAKAIVLVSGFIGNQHVVKPIEVVITKGRVMSDCLVVKPEVVSLSVGLQKDSEIRQEVYITNDCEQPVTITPEIVSLDAREDEDLDLNLAQFTVLSGEQREFELLVTNQKERKRGSTQRYEVYWNNPLYIIDNTKINVDFFNIREVLKVYNLGGMHPQNIIYLTMTQPVSQEPSILYTGFYLKNEGQVPIRDIIISDKPKGLTANISAKIQPITKDILRPGEGVQVNIVYESKSRYTTLDDIIYDIKGYGPGIGSTVSTEVINVFLISPPDCLQIIPKQLNYGIDLGSSQERTITLKNTCAEAVTVYDLDKRDELYRQTFGNNEVSFFPQTSPRILQGQSASFTLKIDASDYHTAYNTPLKVLARTDTGHLIASEQTNIYVDIMPKDERDLQTLRQIQQRRVPVCGSDETTNVSFPLISEDCLRNGYCDGYSAGKVILDKIKALQANIVSLSAQLDNKIENTGCYVAGGDVRSCNITDLHHDLQPIEFDIYLQNDIVSKELLQEMLNRDRQTDRQEYSKINNYLVMDTPATRPTDVSFVGNRIFVPGDVVGCGRYRITIDAAVATTHTDLMPERAYFYVELDDYEKTEVCEKDIQNYQIFLPLNKELSAQKTHNTWLLKFLGDRDFVPDIVKDLFDDDYERYTTDVSAHTNLLNLEFDKIQEKEDALAKVIFGDGVTPTRARPEKLDVILNEDYLVDGDIGKSEHFVNTASKVIRNLIIDRQHIDMCVAEDRSYLLVLDFVEVDDLVFEFKDKNPDLVIKNEKVCKDFIIKSTVGEEVNFDVSSDIDDVTNITYIYEGEETKNLRLVLEEDAEKEFAVCVKPRANNLLGRLVGEKIDVSAISQYVIKGTEGKREVKRQINLEGCGITPVKLLEEINRVSGVMEDKAEDRSFVALVSWNERYSSANQEAFCTTLEKYYSDKKHEGDLFFDSVDFCDSVERPSEMEEAQRERVGSNALTYLGSCFTTCSLCSLGLDAVAGVLTGGTSVKLFGKQIGKDVIGCLISCGIPAGTYVVSESIGDNLKDVTDHSSFLRVASNTYDATIGRLMSGFIAPITEIITPVVGTYVARMAMKDVTLEATGGPLKKGVLGMINPATSTPISQVDVITNTFSEVNPSTFHGAPPSVKGISTVDDYLKVLDNSITNQTDMIRKTTGKTQQAHQNTLNYYNDLKTNLSGKRATLPKQSWREAINSPKAKSAVRKTTNILKIGCHIWGGMDGRKAFSEKAERGIYDGALHLDDNVDDLRFENNVVYKVDIAYREEEDSTQGNHHRISITRLEQDDPTLTRLDNCEIKDEEENTK